MTKTTFEPFLPLFPYMKSNYTFAWKCYIAIIGDDEPKELFVRALVLIGVALFLE